MLKRVLLITAAALALSIAAFGAYTQFGHKGHAEAARLINCTVDAAAHPNVEITCTGKIIVITPLGTKVIDFTLVVDAVDNPPQGPSFGDVINSCTIDFGNGPRPIHIGPCP